MTSKKHYQAPDMYMSPMAYESLLCQSVVGETEDYELVEGFEW